jgi:GPH family glycoside/pentoside/hexuronide:cation symporter
MSFVPAGFAVLAVAVMFFYNLDNKRLTQVQAALSARKVPQYV